MLTHILKTTFSHLRKNRLYTLLNILALSLGIACVFLISLYLRNENAYDRHFANAGQIYRLGVVYTFDDKVDEFANGPRPLATTIHDEFPQVQAHTRIVGINGLFTHSALLKTDEGLVKTEQAFYADSTFFQVFEHDFLAGNPETALNNPNSMVVSDRLAQRLYKSLDVLGKTLKIDNQLEVQITGVFREPPQPTHLPIEALVSWVHDARPGENDRWLGWHTYSYIRLKETAGIEAINKGLPALYEKFMKPTFDQVGGTAKILTQPLTAIHLESDLQWEAYSNGNKTNVYVFFTVAIFIVVLISINYTNLATVQALQRFKEIGIRKILGSGKRLILLQLLADSFITTLLSTALSIALIIIALPYFAEITSISLSASLVLTDSTNLLVLAGLWLIVSVVSGIYPAIYISRFQPQNVVQGQYASGRTGAFVRKILVGIQFFIAVALLFATSTVIRQADYVLSKDLGFDRENTLVVQVRDTTLQKRLESLKNEWLTISGISAAATTTSFPGEALVQVLLDIKEPDGSYNGTAVEFMEVSPEFPETLGMTLLTGRTFDRSMATDLTRALMINEAAAKVLGGAEQALGRKFGIGTDSLGAPVDYEVIGVVNDFHTISLQAAIQPVVIFPTEENTAILLKTDARQNRQVLNQLEAAWTGLNSQFPFEYVFLDDGFISLHSKEADLQELLTWFSALIVFIACLSLVGMVSYTVRLKARELTIRKVIGSSNTALVRLILNSQLLPVFVALIIAIPVAWYVMLQWLENFAYHTQLRWTQALLVALFIVIIALLTMSYHVLKATKTNPAEVLRHE
jgi:putative ABC transport system permease protein